MGSPTGGRPLGRLYEATFRQLWGCAQGVDSTPAALVCTAFIPAFAPHTCCRAEEVAALEGRLAGLKQHATGLCQELAALTRLQADAAAAAPPESGAAKEQSAGAAAATAGGAA